MRRGGHSPEDAARMQAIREQMATEKAIQQERIQQTEQEADVSGVELSADEQEMVDGIIASVEKNTGTRLSQSQREGVIKDVVGRREAVAEAREQRQLEAAGFLLDAMEAISGSAQMAENIFNERIGEKHLEWLGDQSPQTLRVLAKTYVAAAKRAQEQPQAEAAPEPPPKPEKLTLATAEGGHVAAGREVGKSQVEVGKIDEAQKEQELRKGAMERMKAKLEAGGDPNELLDVVDGELEELDYDIDELEEEGGQDVVLKEKYLRRSQLEAQRVVLLETGAKTESA